MVKGYKKKIDSGKVKNQAKLARIKSISRTRVTQILNLLKLDKNILLKIERIGDPLERRVFRKDRYVKYIIMICDNIFLKTRFQLIIFSIFEIIFSAIISESSALLDKFSNTFLLAIIKS